MKTKSIFTLLLLMIGLSNFTNGQIKETSNFNNLTLKGIISTNSHNYGTQTLNQRIDSLHIWQLSIWPDKEWKLTRKQLNNEFDANDNLISYIQEGWNDSCWVPNWKSIYTYDANNNITTELVQQWNRSNWNSLGKSSFTYDAKNNMTSYISQSWRGDWLNTEKGIYTYDANNNMLSYIRQITMGDNWENSQKTVYTYDVKNNKTSHLILNWNWTLQSWEYAYNGTYTYDINNNLISLVEQIWNYPVWNNFEKSTYIYDAHNNRTSSLIQRWKNNNWVISSKRRFSYDINHFTKTETFEDYDTETKELYYSDSTYYYFHNANGINDFLGQEVPIIVYPNPSKGKLTLKSNNALSSIEIYNMTGRLLYSDYNLKRQTSVDIDLSDLQKGIYFARIQDSKQVVTEKIIIQ